VFIFLSIHLIDIILLANFVAIAFVMNTLKKKEPTQKIRRIFSEYVMFAK